MHPEKRVSPVAATHWRWTLGQRDRRTRTVVLKTEHLYSIHLVDVPLQEDKRRILHRFATGSHRLNHTTQAQWLCSDTLCVQWRLALTYGWRWSRRWRVAHHAWQASPAELQLPLPLLARQPAPAGRAYVSPRRVLWRKPSTQRAELLARPTARPRIYRRAEYVMPYLCYGHWSSVVLSLASPKPTIDAFVHRDGSNPVPVYPKSPAIVPYWAVTANAPGA